MMPATMALQDDNGSVDSGSMRNQVPMDVDVSSTKSIHLKEKLHSVDDQAFKVRKPYTITKQRERWTEEEHKKFLEALKLYGRAWRRIEEHVGTKTAVQIRSHAQKFFTKVVRESNTGEADSVKSIEIPPPRPKRKPLHPYPRKVSASAKATALLIEKPMHSGAAEENQSPTSVLSAYCSSDTPGATDSNTPEGSLSPISSVVCGSAGLVLSEQPNLSSANGNASQSSSQMNNSSNQDEKSPVKLELFPEEDSFLKEGSVEVSSTQCLKLFGKTVMVTDSSRPSSSTFGACKVQACSQIDGKETQPSGPLQWNFVPISYPQVDLECSWGALTFGAQATIYCLPRQNEMCSYQKVEAAPIVRAIPIKASLPSDCIEVEKTEALKDGSSSNSSSESPCVDGDSNLEAQSCRLMLGNEERASPSNKHGHGTFFWKHRASLQKRTQGFLPYKRCIADRDARAVALGEEREEQQRTRLCL